MTVYKPYIVEISAVTKAFRPVVTSVEDHAFLPGNTVRFVVPKEFAMIQLDGVLANVLSVTDNTITIDVNTSQFTAFAVPASYTTPAQILPVGDTNYGFTVQGTIPDPITISGAYRLNQD